MCRHRKCGLYCDKKHTGFSAERKQPAGRKRSPFLTSDLKKDCGRVEMQIYLINKCHGFSLLKLALREMKIFKSINQTRLSGLKLKFGETFKERTASLTISPISFIGRAWERVTFLKINTVGRPWERDDIPDISDTRQQHD